MPKTKKPKDPNRPKRPLTAFMYYSQIRRKEIKNTDSTVSMIEISKMIGAEWRELPDTSKRPHHDKAGVAAEQYRALKEAYDKTKPKRPRTAYAFFMKMNRAKIATKYPETAPKDLMKYIAESWKKISDQERETYSNMAVDDRSRWNRDKINIR